MVKRIAVYVYYSKSRDDYFFLFNGEVGFQYWDTTDERWKWSGYFPPGDITLEAIL